METITPELDDVKKDSLVKRILLGGGETVRNIKIGYGEGFLCGLAGRVGNKDAIPVILPIADFVINYEKRFSKGRFSWYISYGLGVLTAYTGDIIYSAIAELVDKI